MLTRYHEPFFSTAFDLFPDAIWTTSKKSDTIDKDGIKVELPGVKSTDVEVVVEGKHLHVKGKTRHGKTFSYVYSLGSEVNLEEITAKLSDGLLEIALPRKVPSHRKIQIDT